MDRDHDHYQLSPSPPAIFFFQTPRVPTPEVGCLEFFGVYARKHSFSHGSPRLLRIPIHTPAALSTLMTCAHFPSPLYLEELRRFVLATVNTHSGVSYSSRRVSADYLGQLYLNSTCRNDVSPYVLVASRRTGSRLIKRD